MRQVHSDNPSMASRDEIQNVIFQTFASVNEDLPADKRLTPEPGTVIFGQGGKLDSLGLVTFVISLESALSERLGKSISLTDEEAMANGAAAFHSVESLVNLIASRWEAS